MAPKCLALSVVCKSGMDYVRPVIFLPDRW